MYVHINIKFYNYIKVRIARKVDKEILVTKQARMEQLKYMQIDKKELHQRCSFTISMKTDLEHFLFTSQRKIQRNKFVLNMIGNQNNNAFKD